MSKPEHTESPAGAPAAKLDDGASAASPAAKPEDVSVPAARAAADAEPDGPKAASASSPAAEPDGDAKPAAAKPRLSKAVPAARAAADAETDGPKAAPASSPAAKPDGAAAPGAEPDGDAKPAAAKPRLSKAAAAAEPEDAEPAAAKPGPGKAVPADEPEDAKPAAATSGSGKDGAARPAASKTAVGATGGNPVVEKADAMAAAVKAAAAKAAGGGHDEGRLLAGRYRLNSVLGKGGMGTVWRAQDETLGRTVAVKELRFSSGVDEDEKRRLITRTLREAKAIARIRSGGAVTVYDVVDEDARPWIVMELIEGPSLAEFIRENGPLTPHRAAEVGLAVLDVLRAAHGQGILHRDVKPSNVLIAGNGRVVLTDFGIAQVEGDPSVTSTGMLVGAPSYISPERARGQKPGPPADMWSLGGLLYASVEGVPPYDKGSALATLTAVMTEPVDPPKNAGPLTEVIYGLLAKDPARRLDEGRARAMLTAVLAAPEPVPAPVPAVAEETRQISLADAREAAEKATAEKAAEKAAKKERERREREQRERARAAVKAARKAQTAAAAAATPAVSAAEAPKRRPASVVAPLTDVMPRRTIALAVVAVVAVLAVVGSLIAWAVSGDDKDKKNQGKGGQATPAASAPQTTGGAEQGSPKPSGNTGETGTGGSAGTGTGTGADAGAGAQGQGQGQGQQTAGQGQGQGQGATNGGAGGALPAGYAVVTEPGFHFSMAMPEGFKRTAIAGDNSGGIFSRDGGFPRIQVDFTDKPGDDAALAWTKLAPAVGSSSKGYRLIRIDKVQYRGYPTVADWEFEREQSGTRVRVLNRGFKIDATHGYAIMISCPADQWDGPECTQMRNVAFETFRPLG
ncbi:serine/threonine-protein kinase [Streptomyces sp. IGB124]|uniref:serine/threonine-protein kinase n=1 Tax=Streptomyces sp. IGB124 TaxID=1519485 RepID=UPI0006AE59B6|nr:serine/threonine-protein kinase [Streptomyces sp. IGB124]KOU65154.1 serine/threonine protein kinase [Streptomyces sp. IGB124]